jgi:hypothetical protein
VVAHLESEAPVRLFLVFVGLAVLAYIGFKYVVRGAPQPHFSNIATLPGVALSKLSFHGGDLSMIIVVIGGAILALLIAYMAVSK